MEFAVNLISLLCGMMLTWSSSVLAKLSSANSTDNPLGREITSSEQSWIASLASLGGIAGPSLVGLAMDNFGRKVALACVHLPNIAATLIAAFGNNIWYFYVSRVLAGMSISGGISMVAVYFGEIAERQHRGFLYSTTSISINLGTLLSYCIGPFTTIMVFNLILLGIAVIGLIGTLTILESPYYLVKNLELHEAQRVLEILRNSDFQTDLNLHKEFLSIRREVSNKVYSEGITNIFRSKAARRSLVMSLIVTAAQQLSGVVVIYSYTQLIFYKSGSQLNPIISAILVGVAQLTTISITTFVVDKLGRKNLLAFSSTGLAFTLAILATFFRFQDLYSDSTTIIDWLPLVCLMLFFVFFNSGLSNIPFLYMSEILPLNVKSISTAIVMANYCLVSFLVTFFYNNIVEGISVSGAFYLFAGSMASFSMYVMIGLFETKGKSLQEIQQRLTRSTRSKNAFQTS